VIDLTRDLVVHFFRGTDVNTALLAVIAVDNKRIIPMLRGVCDYFKIRLPRARTEPGIPK
jgi:hypothetical protein